MLPEKQEAYGATVSGAWLEVGLFFWLHHKGMVALVGILCPDSVIILDVSFSEYPVWKSTKVGGLTGASQVTTRWSLKKVAR